MYAVFDPQDVAVSQQEDKRCFRRAAKLFKNGWVIQETLSGVCNDDAVNSEDTL